MSLSKFKRALEKKEIPVGLPTVEKWLSFNNYAINWVCTGSFRRGIPHRRSILIGGESGATKTMNILQLAANAQNEGYHVVLLDSETSITDQDLEMNLVDTCADKFTPIAVTTHEEVIEIFTEALKAFGPEEKIFFILDSIGGLMTEAEDANFDKGKASNDMGRIVQANKKILRLVGNRIRHRDWFFVSSAHVYQNQDLLNGKGRWIFSNVGSALYFPSLSLQLTKLDLRDGQDQTGIRVDVTTKKNRFFKLGQKVRLNLVYEDRGFDKYDGVLDILKDYGYIQQSGAWYSFDRIDENGEITETVKFQSKNFSQYAEELIDRYEHDHAGVFSEIEETEEIMKELEEE